MRILAQDFVTDGVRRVNWTPVYDTLRGKREVLGEQNELTTLAYTLLAQTDWQAIVESAEYLTQADDMLMGYLEDQCLTWIESPEARRHTGSVGQFANTVLDTYFDAVNWEEVTSALRGE